MECSKLLFLRLQSNGTILTTLQQLADCDIPSLVEGSGFQCSDGKDAFFCVTLYGRLVPGVMVFFIDSEKFCPCQEDLAEKEVFCFE